MKRVISLTLWLLSACGGVTEPPAPPSLLPAEQLLARRLDDASLQSFIAQESGRIQPISTWDFAALYWTAIYENPILAETKAMVGAARAAKITAGQKPNPTISFLPSFDNSASPSAWLLGLGLSVPIETNGKRYLRVSAVSEQINSAEHQLVSKAWDIRAQVLRSLIDLHIAREGIKRNQTLLGTQEAIIEEYDKRSTQGQMPSAFASHAQVNYQQTLLQLEQAKTDAALAEVTLAAALGVSVQAIKAVQVADTLPDAVSAASLSHAVVLRQHPSVLAALADYRAAHELLKLEVAKQVPDVNIGPGYQWNSQQGSKYTLGISFVLPVANKNEGPIAEANAKRLLAARRFESAQAAVLNQIEQAETAYQSALREQASAAQIVQLQSTKQQRLNRVITHKASATLPLLYAKNDVQMAQAAQLFSYAKLWRAKAALENATRQPLFGAVVGGARLMRGTR